MYFVYILWSKTYNKTYIGITTDLYKRLEQHNRGYHPYTKRFKPWMIIYREVHIDRLTARKKEKYYKSAAGRKWIKKNIFAEVAE